MRNSIQISDLPFRSLLKLSLVTLGAFWIPVGVFIGVMGLLGFDTVTFQEEQVYGVQAFLTAIVVAGVFSIGGTIIFGLGAAVLKLLSKFSVNVSLDLKRDVHAMDSEAAE